MDEIQVELNELRKLKKQNVNSSKASANLRKLFQILTNEISSLNEMLHKDSRAAVMYVGKWKNPSLFFFFFGFC